MNNRTLLRTGIIGAVVAALCCATPLLVILLGAVGLLAWGGWLDVVLLPALALFVAITVYALWRRRSTTDACDVAVPGKNGSADARADS